MFDMSKIGKKIAALRKQKGLTQMELADKMGISFQAVSNWERGNTMPDISKLPELAEIFGCDIGEILVDERKGKIVEEIANGEQPDDLKAEDLADIAPIVNDEQFKKTYEQAQKNDVIDFETVVEIAPYLDDDVLAELVKNYVDYGLTAKQVLEIAPFIDDEILDDIALNMPLYTPLEEIGGLAPFLSEEALSKIADKYIDKCKIADFEDLVVHMNERDVANLARKYLSKHKNVAEIEPIAPFMDEDDLTEIASEYIQNGGNFKDLTEIAPFLDMNGLFKKFLKK